MVQVSDSRPEPAWRRRVAPLHLDFRLLAQRAQHQQPLGFGRWRSLLREPHRQLGHTHTPADPGCRRRPSAAARLWRESSAAPRRSTAVCFTPACAPASAAARRPSQEPQLGRGRADAGIPRGVEHVPLPQGPHAVHEGRAVAIHAVAAHPPKRQAVVNRRLQEFQRQLRPAAKHRALRYACLLAPLRIIRPFLRQEGRALIRFFLDRT